MKQNTSGATVIEAADEQIEGVSVTTDSDAYNGVVEIRANAETADGSLLHYRFKPRSEATISEPKTLAIKEARKATAEGRTGEYPRWGRIALKVPPGVVEALETRGYTLA